MAESALGNKVVNSERAPEAAFRPLGPRQLRDRVRGFQWGRQARLCGVNINQPAILARVAGKGGQLVHAVVGGESRCRSPRCPKCRNGIMSARADQIQFCIDRWLEEDAGHRITMITLTAPHYSTWSLPRFLGSTALRQGMLGARALLMERTLWRANVEHYVSGLEITHGRNGWHAHFHLLIFHRRDLVEADWYSAWRSSCLEAGLNAPSTKRGIDITRAESAAEYMAKWSVASEGTAQHVKQAKGGNRAVWQLEQAAAAGEGLAARKLFSFNLHTFRRRWHNFSRGLADWRKEWERARPQAEALLVFDSKSSKQLAVDEHLAKLVASIAADAPDLVEQVPQALGLQGERPAEPDLVWVVDPAAKAYRRYNKALEEERWQDASMQWIEYDFYVQTAIHSAAYQQGQKGGWNPPQTGNRRTFDPDV